MISQNVSQNAGLFAAALLFALVAGALGFSAGYFLPLSYDDFIAGDATWRAAGKASDVLAIFAFILGFAASLRCLTTWHARIERTQGLGQTHAWARLLGLAFLPLAFWLGCQMLSATPPSFVPLGMGAAALAAALLLYRAQSAIDPLHAESLAMRGFAVALLTMLAPLSLCFVRARFHWPMLPTLIASGLLLAAFALWWCWILFRNTSKPTAQLSRMLLAAQALLIPFYAALLPTPYTMAGVDFTYPTTPLLRGLVVALMFAAALDLFRRARSRPQTFALDGLFSPLCLAALIVALLIPISPAPMIFADDYHHGEHLLPLWMWLSHGALPYVDISLAHGFADDLLSAVSAKLFLSDVAANYYAAGQIARGFLTTVLFLAAVPVLGLPFAFLTGLLAGGLQPWYLLALTYLFLLYRLRGHITLVPVSVFGGYTLFLGWPGLGAAFLIALAFPVTIWSLRVHPMRRLLGWNLATSAAIVLLWFIFPPLLPITLGALRYVIENGGANFEAYGIPWYASWGASPQKTGGAIFEAVRFSWVLLPLLAAWLYAQGRLTWREDREAILLLCFGMVFLLLTLSYTMGRIDPGYMFRAGQASMVALLLAGWVLLPRCFPAGRVLLLAALAFWAASFTAIPQDPLAQIWKSFRDQREGAPLTDFTKLDFPWMGIGVADPAHLARIEEVRSLVDKVAEPNETFLDLTNRTALYYYLHRPMPIEVASYNQPLRAMQERSIARLTANPPPLVLLAADGFQHDGRSVAIRAHWIYRWVMAHYVPVRVGKLIVGVLPERQDRLDVDPAQAAQLWDEAFRISQLDRLPIAWGRADALANKMTKIIAFAIPQAEGMLPEQTGFRVAGNAPAFRFALPTSLRGKDAGIFAFDLHCAKRDAAPIFDLRWREAGTPMPTENSVRFQAASGHLLVPLDAMPRWLNAEKIQGLTLAIIEGGSCEIFNVENAGLYQRR